MKPTLDTRVQDALVTAQNMEMAASGTAGKLAYSLRQQLDEIVDEVARMTYEYGVAFQGPTGSLILQGFVIRTGHGSWFDNREEAEKWISKLHPPELSTPNPYRIMRRLVGEPEIVE